ncbi:MAG: peptidylprolyl isomerase [Owenweeksia sp.]
MFIKISISIRSLLIFIIALGSLASACDRPESASALKKEEAGDNTSSSTAKKDKDTDDAVKLTNKNCTNFLQDYGKRHSENTAVIKTDFGDIIISLYNNTPLHRANFLYLTEREYFDNTWFYRVSRDHVIQAGNNDDPQTLQKRSDIGEYTIPSEIKAGNIHKRGAVAAARSYYQNPDKRSDPYEFYICLGKSYSYKQLKAMEEEYDIKLDSEQMKVYASEGGAPHLDEEHTVFGEVIKGMDVVEKINKVRVDEGEWPLDNIPISIQIIN